MQGQESTVDQLGSAQLPKGVEAVESTCMSPGPVEGEEVISCNEA